MVAEQVLVEISSPQEKKRKNIYVFAHEIESDHEVRVVTYSYN